MVEGGIEDLALGGIQRLDFDLAEGLHPGVDGLALNHLELHPFAGCALFGVEVGLGAGLTDRGDAHADRDFLVLGRVEEQRLCAFGLPGIRGLFRRQGLFLPEGKRLGEFRIEIGDLVAGPAHGAPVALQMGIVDLFKGPVGGDVPADAAAQVQQDGALVRAERVFMDGGAGGGAQSDIYAIVVQPDLVIAGHDEFLAVVEVGVYMLGFLPFPIHEQAGVQLLGWVVRHEHDIAEVADAGSGQVGVAETDDEGVALMVAGAPVPGVDDLLRSGLHHAEGDVGADEDMAMAAGTDGRIDLLEQFGHLNAFFQSAGNGGKGEKSEE